MALLVFAAQMQQLGLGWKTLTLTFKGLANDYIYITLDAVGFGNPARREQPAHGDLYHTFWALRIPSTVFRHFVSARNIPEENVVTF